jgi:hypothetical protein
VRLVKCPPPPPARARDACPGCGAMAPEVLVPAEAAGGGGEPVGYCWICAHLVTEHDAGAELSPATFQVWFARCTCARSRVFPEREFPPGQGERPVHDGPTEPATAIVDPEAAADLEREIAGARARLGELERRRQALGPLRYARVPASVRQAQSRAAGAIGGATAAARRAAGR